MVFITRVPCFLAIERTCFLLALTSLATYGQALQPGRPDARHFMELLSKSDMRMDAMPRDVAFETEPAGLSFVDTSFAFVFFLFALVGFHDLHSFLNLASASPTSKIDVISADGKDEVATSNWSIVELVGLTSYRFYTGFLSATWLPYLLAMEGEELWHENQSLFMGLAKLIYGVTILINPIMGRVGDRAVAVSHGLGRKLFVRIGISMSALGIFVCLLAARYTSFYPFIFGIFTWRLGEALNDVTTEAIIPEMVPTHQFQVAGSIKAAQFLLGGLLGYVLLIVMVNVHYTWLYYAYMVGMLICAMPTICLLNKHEHPRGALQRRDSANQETFGEALIQAYLVPMRQEGGFPRYCLATFIFTLGTSPMFFLLLIVRDLIGVGEPTHLQRLFSIISIVFFISAAVASILTGLGSPRRQGASDDNEAAQRELITRRWRMLVVTQVVFAFIVLFIPTVALFDDTPRRIRFFYGVAAVFGACFGSGYSRFQDAAWQVLPVGDRQANAMGFNTMCRLLGVGVGNFAAGLCLDFFKTGHAGPSLNPMGPQDSKHYLHPWLEGSSQVYDTAGYVVMCAACCCLNLLSAMVTATISVSNTQRCREAG
eukprot:TRINITY_DN54719_c0_g1_i1.p1 TRINITY_DN54719_c0_g1~~TRINITY_DN54719_c0_g1_i1.p1  ORF type:complete len:615 (+),score=52.46 TRINITY_DN54719_c0_g1_i1:50-1846(+)